MSPEILAGIGLVHNAVSFGGCALLGNCWGIALSIKTFLFGVVMGFFLVVVVVDFFFLLVLRGSIPCCVGKGLLQFSTE